MTLSEFITKLDDIAWGSVVLCLLVGVGLILSISTRFLQFRKFGHAMKNTVGKVFKKQQAGKGEVTPLQALTTALAATVGTGNIAGVTGAIVIGGPGAVFWMWLSALVGMCTKFAEVTLAVNYRERNDKGDWVGGPMYYIKNGLGKGFGWLSVLFCIFGFLAAFGIGNATQVQSIGESIGSAINALGGNVQGTMLSFAGNEFTLCNLIVGIVVAVIVALVLFGGIKRIGSVTEKIVPVMAVVYIISTLIVIFTNIGHIGQVFGMIFKGAFNAEAALRTVSAVRLQITMVSMNTSKMPKKPCLTGLVSLVAAWAIGAEPRPASLKKQPRAMPLVMEVEIVMPNAPPSAASALKAPLKIMPKTWPMWLMLAKITTSEAMM